MPVRLSVQLSVRADNSKTKGVGKPNLICKFSRARVPNWCTNFQFNKSKFKVTGRQKPSDAYFGLCLLTAGVSRAERPAGTRAHNPRHLDGRPHTMYGNMSCRHKVCRHVGLLCSRWQITATHLCRLIERLNTSELLASRRLPAKQARKPRSRRETARC